MFRIRILACLVLLGACSASDDPTDPDEVAGGKADLASAQPCGGFAGLSCPDGLVCVDDPGDGCDNSAGGADCPAHCEDPSQGGEGQTCGGFAGIACPVGLVCLDDPDDDCDNSAGGADCPGICVRTQD